MKDLSSAAPQGQDASVPNSASTDQQWSCQAFQFGLKNDTPLEVPLTVGQKFVLKCEGPPVALDSKLLRFELPESEQWSLRLLDVQSLGEAGGDFVATTWTTGDIKLKNAILTDGARRVGLGEISLTSASVIKPETNPEAKPYPPWGPLAMPLPLWMWGIVAALIAALAGALWLAIRHSLRRKRLLARLEKNAVVLSPYNQFNKDLRRIGRQIPTGERKEWSVQASTAYFQELDSIFRWYLARELILPSFELSPRHVLRDLMRLDRSLHDQVSRDLRLALRELHKAMNAKTGVSTADAIQISELCRKLADQITKSRSE